ncbi:hypothetical protein H6P81_014891 [Aristolochia fimbriata]|uniref:Uncharacterized protein n=1 Tax=Aristolochia fimbriata TaxID=158543 RepID=A0AAV7E6V1_ARIFI|nr:hypothetical protein H6P81_014891 [Aristolochia fimbriata]
MEGSMKDVEVRSLDGQSTRVSVSLDCTVGELKSMLKEFFPPAKTSPNFHLYHKGVKMRQEFQIIDISNDVEGFVVLVPFSPKNIPPTKHKEYDDNNLLLRNFHDTSMCTTSESAWSDIMQDLSVLSKMSTEGLDSRRGFEDTVCGVSKSAIGGSSKIPSLNGKQKSCLKGQEKGNIILSILQTGPENGFGGHHSCDLHRALGSTNCLTNSLTGNCLLSEEFGALLLQKADMVQVNYGSECCACPTWLQKMLKSFTFLNIYSGFIQMHGQEVTYNHLKEAMNQFNSSSLGEVSIVDIENLSVICPKIVKFVNQESAAIKLDEIVVIMNSLTQLADQCESERAGKKLSAMTIMKAIERRESTFKRDIWGTIKWFVGKTLPCCGSSNFFSLSDLLIFLKEKNVHAQISGQKRKRKTEPNRYTHCKETCQLLPVEMVEHLRKVAGSNGQIAHVEEIGGRAATFVDLPEDLSEPMKLALHRIGISKLYSHQADSVKALLSGNDVVVATATSSGKSLCYNLPVLEDLSQNLSSCAMYLFPTKALAQDQLRTLMSMTTGLSFSLNIGIYDGDTPQDHRSWLRDNARLLITNPDMLHMTILPHHRKFERILANLRFIVIDEAHSYKGAFGCHISLVLRRLLRICSHVYGSHPSFVLCTATSANPREHAMELVNLQNLELIQNDGSPCGAKLFVLWNPPLNFLNVSKSPSSTVGNSNDDTEVVTKRSSSILEASCLFAEMVQHGLRCIAFCKTRKLCELVLTYTREILEETAPSLIATICAYRGGYTAKDRRKIESDFFGGKLRGVAATNALELGIDVGHVDATLHLGFPGSIASLWQQAGRSGRRERPSIAVYIAFGGPLDQYYMKYPQKLFGSPIEHCQIDSHNKQVLEQHLSCAALELPLCLQHDERYFGSGLDGAIKTLENKGYLFSDPSRAAKTWNYIGVEKKPSHSISIRAIEAEKYKVINTKTDEVLEEIEESKAFFQVYEGAVYMHQGKTYLVKLLDLSQKTAFCQEADLKYYTKTRDYTDIHVIGGNLAYPVVADESYEHKTTAQSNFCTVTTTWFGFYRIWHGSNQIFDTVDLALPNFSYDSQAVWIRIPQSIKTEAELQFQSFRAGQHAACHALLSVVPLYVTCNSSDMGSECANPHDTRYVPERLLLYDRHPGGIGLSAQVQTIFSELLTAALELLTTCNCSASCGCPNCVQIPTCSEYNEVLDKNAAIMILQGVIESERSILRRNHHSCGTSKPL